MSIITNGPQVPQQGMGGLSLNNLRRKDKIQMKKFHKEGNQEGLNELRQKLQIKQALEGNQPQSNLMYGLGLFAGKVLNAAYQAHRQDTLHYQQVASAAADGQRQVSAGMLGAMSASNTGFMASAMGTLYQPMSAGGGMGMMGMGMPGMMGMGMPGMMGMGMPGMMGMGMGMGMPGMMGMGGTPLPNMPVPFGMGMGGTNPAFEQQIAQMANMIAEQRQGMAKLFEMIQQKTNAGVTENGGTENNDTIKPESQFGDYLMPPKIGEKIENWDTQYHADGTSIDDKLKIREELKKYLTQNQSAINDYNDGMFTLPLDEVKIQALVDTILPKSELYPFDELKSIGLTDFSTKKFIKHVDKSAINNVISVIQSLGGDNNTKLSDIVFSADDQNSIINLGQHISTSQLGVLKDMTLEQLTRSRGLASEQKPDEVKGFDGGVNGLGTIKMPTENTIQGSFDVSGFPQKEFMNLLKLGSMVDPEKITVTFHKVNVSESALNSGIQDNNGGTITLQYKERNRDIQLSGVFADTLPKGNVVRVTHTAETPLQTAATGLLDSVKKLHELLKSENKDHKAIKEATVNLKTAHETYETAAVAVA